MSALTQFFGSGGGSQPESTLPVEVLVVTGGHGALRCRMASGLPAWWPGIGGLTHYSDIMLCPGITVPITVGYGGTSYLGARFCTAPSPGQNCCFQYGSAGGGSCFGECVYVCVQRSYDGVNLDSILVSASPAPQACLTCVERTKPKYRSSVLEFGIKVMGGAPNIYFGGTDALSRPSVLVSQTDRSSNFTSPGSLSGYQCTADYDQIAMFPDPVSPIGYLISGGTVKPSNGSDYFTEYCVSCRQPSCCLINYGAKYFDGFASDITGVMGSYGRGLVAYSSGAWGINSPQCSSCSDWQIFGGCVGYGRGGVACVCDPNPVDPAVISQADTGSVVVKYPIEYDASSITSPNYCDCSPLTPGYRTYRFLCPGSITLP